MNGSSESTGHISPTVSGSPLKTAGYALLSLFFAVVGTLIARTLAPFQLPLGEGAWAAAALILALATTLISLSTQLPFQNVLLAGVIVGIIGGVIQGVGVLTGIPFGPLVYSENAGPQLFNRLPWFVPLLWVFAVLNSRGVARLILRPWRKLRVYGYWLIGLTAGLTLLFAFGLEPFATKVEHFWFWRPTKLPIDWYGAPLSNFLGWLVVALLILAFATPSLMKKKPTKSASDYSPLIVWIVVNLLFMAGTASRHLWLAVAVNALACGVVIPFAVRGAAW